MPRLPGGDARCGGHAACGQWVVEEHRGDWLRLHSVQHLQVVQQLHPAIIRRDLTEYVNHACEQGRIEVLPLARLLQVRPHPAVGVVLMVLGEVPVDAHHQLAVPGQLVEQRILGVVALVSGVVVPHAHTLSREYARVEGVPTVVARQIGLMQPVNQCLRLVVHPLGRHRRDVRQSHAQRRLPAGVVDGGSGGVWPCRRPRAAQTQSAAN